MSRRRVERLEQQIAGEEPDWPEPQTIIREGNAIDRWLESIGMNARDALAVGLAPPAELDLRWTSLADMAEAEQAVEDWCSAGVAEPSETI